MLFSTILSVLLIPLAFTEGKVFHVQGPNGRYSMTYGNAHGVCKQMGAHLASYKELKEAWLNGYEECSCGWLMDRSARYPMQQVKRGCGNKKAIHSCSGSKYDAYCFQADFNGDTYNGGVYMGNCTKPLGMESNEIKDFQIDASSHYRTWYGRHWYDHYARLHEGGFINAWIPAVDSRRQYLQVDLEKATAVTGVVMQGVQRYNRAQYVTAYTVQYSKDGYNWKTYEDEDGNVIVLDGAHSRSTPSRSMFERPILTRFIRIHPHEWHKHAAMRIELLGCDMTVYDEADARSRDRPSIEVITTQKMPLATTAIVDMEDELPSEEVETTKTTSITASNALPGTTNSDSETTSVVNETDDDVSNLFVPLPGTFVISRTGKEKSDERFVEFAPPDDVQWQGYN